MAFIPQSGSVVAFQGNPSVLQVLATVTNPSTGSVSGAVTAPPGSVMTVVTPASSVQAIRTDSASVIAVIQASSIVGTYAEDAGHTSADKGIFVLAVRNDT